MSQPVSPRSQNDEATAVTVTAASVTVWVRDKLGLETWREVRDARETARQRDLRLRIDLSRCPDASMGGVGALLLVEERLGSLCVTGCPDHLSSSFDRLGICNRCMSSDACADRRRRLRSPSSGGQ